MALEKKRARRIWVKLLRLSIPLLLILLLAAWGSYRYTFPYGESHCCILVLGSALRSYAEEHNGRFPSGQATPEASLSLLAKADYGINAYILRGKTVPLEVASNTLAKDGVLGPESCGWHYVEGLTLADNPDIAIVWDKVGLGHNGQRLKRGGHEVLLLDGSHNYITGQGWPAFLQTQKELLAKRRVNEKNGIPALQARIKMPDGNILDHYDGSYTLEDTTQSSNGNGTGKTSGSQPELKWYYFYQADATITYNLTLPAAQLRSKPVSFQVKDHAPSTNLIVFEMEKF
jgi:hypothetical protein